MTAEPSSPMPLPGPPEGSSQPKKAGKKKRPKNAEGRMSLHQHLVELRNRIVIATVFILIGSIGGWFLYEPVLRELETPLRLAAEERNLEASVNYGSVAAPFDFKLRYSFLIGVVISSPFWIWQLWAFVTPGLTKKERRYILGFTLASIPLFFAGCYLAFLFLPVVVPFLLAFTPEGSSNLINIQNYLPFVSQIILVLGFAFLVPVFMVALNFIGLVSAKQYIASWRWMVVTAFFFAALTTPTPDVVSMFMLATPLMALFAVAVGICAWHDRLRRRKNPFADLDDSEASPLATDPQSANPPGDATK